MSRTRCAELGFAGKLILQFLDQQSGCSGRLSTLLFSPNIHAAMMRMQNPACMQEEENATMMVKLQISIVVD